MTAGSASIVIAQPVLDVHLVAQSSFFTVSSPKVASEACDHS
nr:hypothetical protein [Comamonas koreensis]